ncbi:MAG: response regulator, partial [Bacteroidetes bacterium]|nr:response regulator [Bacteroidota bacterium]
SELLLEKNTNEDYKQYISGIISGGKSLQGIISDILDLSKIEAKKLVILNEHVDIVELCDEITQLFAFTAKDKGIQIIVNSNSLIHRYFILDEARLRQILLNLIGNSLKFTFEGKIEIQLINSPSDKDHDNIMIKVLDTGIGIAFEQQDKVFTPFQQDPEQDNRVFGGTGLGLSISKRLAELMNGSISFESEAKKGSIFTLKLSNVERSKRLANTSNLKIEPLKKVCFKKASVLIVEDNENNRTVIKTFLISFNFETKEAVNGAEAIEILKNYHPDLIFMDIQMPVMDGYETFKNIRDNHLINDIPIIALTAGAIGNTIEKLQNTFNSLLLKPFSKNDLVNELKKFIPYTETDESDLPASESTTPSLEINSEHLDFIFNILYPRWKETAILLSNDEIEEFALNAKDFAAKNNFFDILEWSNSVLLYSKKFNIRQLYEVYNKFPSLLNKYQK